MRTEVATFDQRLNLQSILTRHILAIPKLMANFIIALQISRVIRTLLNCQDLALGSSLVAVYFDVVRVATAVGCLKFGTHLDCCAYLCTVCCKSWFGLESVKAYWFKTRW